MDTGESETTADDQSPGQTTAGLDRGSPWNSSFLGDRAFQDDLYQVADHVKVGTTMTGDLFVLNTRFHCLQFFIFYDCIKRSLRPFQVKRTLYMY